MVSSVATDFGSWIILYVVPYDLKSQNVELIKFISVKINGNFLR